MADETTNGPGGASSNTRESTGASAPEPVILEEHIVAPAPEKRKEAAAVVPPSPDVPIPPAPPHSASAPLNAPPSGASGEHLARQDVVAASAPSVPTPPTSETPKELGDDIAKILQEVKLPERRSTPSNTQQPVPKKFDTNLGAMLDDPTSQIPNTSPLNTPRSGVSGEHLATQQDVLATPPQPTSLTTPAPIILEESVAPQPSQPTADKTSVVAVHTLKDDLQHVVREQKISVVRAVSLEQDRKKHAGVHEKNFQAPSQTPAQAQRSKRIFGILFSVVLLIVLGASALGGVYLIAKQRAGSAPQQTMQSILFAESTVALPIGARSSSDIKRILGNARQSTSGTLGSITRIAPTVTDTTQDGTTTTRPATFAEFMKAVSTGAPDELIRATGSDFFFGIHTVDKNAPLIVVSVTSYDRAFAALLAWEPTMSAELSPIFTPLSAQTTDQNGLPTNRTFQDLVMRNYDVRALKDDVGDVQLYYSFPTQNILIIAESPYSFAEVLSRLQAERKL